MFRFYQTGEKTPWVPIKDGPDVEARARREGAIKLTVLAVSMLPDPETGQLEGGRYSGPMYFDIDFPAEQRGRAIESTKLLCERLQEKGIKPEQFSIFCSGNKGFHVLIPETAFHSGRPLADLPHTYREIALDLYVDGMDMAVYRTGRGCCWRLSNTPREGGTYCVPLTFEELQTLTSEGYDALVSAPREIPPREKISSPLSALEVMFENARARVKRAPKVEKGVPEEELKPFAEYFPRCIESLREGQRLEGATFNAVALQVATFIARAGVEERAAEPLLSDLSRTQGSEQYKTPSLRAQHLRGLSRYVAATGRYQFSCSAMRALLPESPCAGCTLAQGAAASEPSRNTTEIFEYENGYWKRGDPPKRLTNFTLIPIDEFRAAPRPGYTPTVLARNFEVTVEGRNVGVRFFDNDVWLSRTNFLKAVNDIPDCIYYGTDLQVQGIKHYLSQCGYEPGEIMEVKACGIHRTYYDDEPLWVYVEPGFSVNSNRVCGTHYLADTVNAAPHLAKVVLPDPEGKLEEQDAYAQAVRSLKLLLKINNIETIGILLGWFCAAHIRPHCMEAFREFPLLNVWGASGTGKTTTTELFMWLAGVGDKGIGQAIDAPGTSRYAITAYLSTSTSVVRRVEEYNKSKISRDLYRQIGDLLKASFNGNIATRGAIGKNANTTSDLNAKVVQLPIDSPICYLSEQTTTVPALSARSVQLQMTPGGLAAGRPYFAPLQDKARKEALLGIAKLLVYSALSTRTEEVRDLVEAQKKYVPEALGDRPRMCYQIVLAGLDFFLKTLELQGIRDVDSELLHIRESLRGFIRYQASALTAEKLRSEVDEVLEDMALMAHLSEQASGAQEWLTAGRHFAVDGEYLYLDVRASHAIYKRFKRQDGVVIESTDQFLKLLFHEPYFVSGTVKCSKLPTHRPLVCLSIEKMQQKGVDISLFPGAL